MSGTERTPLGIRIIRGLLIGVLVVVCVKAVQQCAKESDSETADDPAAQTFIIDEPRIVCETREPGCEKILTEMDQLTASVVSNYYGGSCFDGQFYYEKMVEALQIYEILSRACCDDGSDELAAERLQTMGRQMLKMLNAGIMANCCWSMETMISILSCDDDLDENETDLLLSTVELYNCACGIEPAQDEMQLVPSFFIGGTAIDV